MPDYDSYAAAITIRENVLRTALQTAYAGGSSSSRQFTEDLSHSGATIKPAPALFLGEPDINCNGALIVPGEGTPGAVIVTQPVRGPVSVTADGQTTTVGIAGQAQIAIAPQLGHGSDKSNIAFTAFSAVSVPSWTATVTTPGTSATIADLLTGDAFRQQLETVIRVGVLEHKITLPDIPAGFLIDLPAAAASFEPRVRDGVLLIGVGYGDDTRRLYGTPEDLQDFAGSHDVAAAVNPAAADLMFTSLRDEFAKNAQDNGATLKSFTVPPQNGFFRCSGTISDSAGSLNFSFRLVPSMFHTRLGRYFTYVPKPRHVNSRTWPALDMGVEDVQTDVDRAWWVVVFGEIVGGVFTLGFLPVYIETKISRMVDTFTNKVAGHRPGKRANRIQKTVPPPGGIAVRIGLDQFDVATDGVRVGISVQPTPSPAILYGPTTVPQTYAHETLRYILQPPSGVIAADPALRIRWTLEDRDANTVLTYADGPAANRLRFEFTPAVNTATNFGLTARLYRQLGTDLTDLGTCSVNLHMRPALAPQSYVRWRWQAKNPQIILDDPTETWNYNGDKPVDRWSNWHRTDAPCHAVHAPGRYRYNIETADRLPFDLKLLENHRGGLCSYCFYGGPAGINPHL